MASPLILSCCLLVALVASGQGAPQDKLDSVDVDSIINNDRLLLSHISCVMNMDDGKCTPEDKEVKTSYLGARGSGAIRAAAQRPAAQSECNSPSTAAMASPLILSCCLLVALVASGRAAPEDKLDSVDVDAVLSNERLLESHISCVLDENDGKCTPEGKEVKSRLPHLVTTGCADCTPTQLERAVKILKAVTERHPAEWTKLKAKYDPTGQYAKEHAETWKKHGINF